MRCFRMVEKPSRSAKEQALPLKKTQIRIDSKELASCKPLSRKASRNVHSKQAFSETSEVHRSHTSLHRTSRVPQLVRTVEHRFEVVPATPLECLHEVSCVAVPRHFHQRSHDTVGICLQLPSSNYAVFHGAPW